MEINLPTGTQGKVDLTDGIKTKVTADGPGGECAKFVIAQSIDVDANLISAKAALVHEKEHFRLFRLGEKNNAYAHKVFDEINTVSRGIAQELKILKAPNYMDINVYGFSFNAKGANDFPAKEVEFITLFEDINTHYLTFAPGTCEIEPYLVAKEYVMATLATKLAGAVTAKADSVQNFKDAKTETQYRNEDMATPELDIHKFADFMQIRHKDDLRVAGDYTFETSDAPTTEKDQISIIPALNHKQLQHIVIGSVMTNMTGKPVQVFKGTHITGAGETIPGYGELLMSKGYSNAIVACNDPLKDGIVKVRVRR